MLAIIGGSGLSRLPALELTRHDEVATPFGEPSSRLSYGQLHGHPVIFLPRHGCGHTIPPHRINYRANIWALQHAGATTVLSIATVGSICADLVPGSLVVPHQIIDYTWSRAGTYFDDSVEPVRHIDFTHPYDHDLRQHILQAAAAAGEQVFDGGVYAATQGPRLETAAEVNRLERDGADIIGMTGMPEAALARELGLAYAALNVVANQAAGRGDSAGGIAFKSIDDVLAEAMLRVHVILEYICRS